ncbi:glycerol-3-phosphate dehydrogenase [Sneathiella marina]|uniref:Glycerol-3-phosphate dehydrogenase n=1 Tax=Sneathiella marina TaxID=2950108 RepID=A0ABY4W9F8_9PROT|nr:glycerol-3-phosphate dehydrogenase [Sneathiella marina]USG61909.1 glycerol-3-phosphate dehydrogenase [Sneathiella marina]
MSADFDVFIIGGGINGCGIARDAVGRGYSVGLCEMSDLASGTSSGSTKLIHGGLRYLEHYEFRLVQKALSEREVLWANAPHIIWPLRFVLPHHRGLRPAWLLRLGLYIYDYIGGRKKLPATKTIDLATNLVGKPLKPLFSKGFEYSDCWVNDSRLVVLNALDAAHRGARIETRTKCVSAVRKDKIWHVTTEDMQTGLVTVRTANLLINAAGPWVDDVLVGPVKSSNSKNVRLVQGSHIVVPRIFDHDRCYIFQNSDDRIIFAIPYEHKYTLIGTTDQDYVGDAGDVAITPEEITYLCAAASEYFEKPVCDEDVVWTYSGVRPLFDDGASMAQEATRDYVLRQDGRTDDAPLLNVFGGKITTYRVLAEAVLEMVEANLSARGPAWTKQASLPGGDFSVEGFTGLLADVQKKYPFLDAEQAERMVRAYGTLIYDLLADSSTYSDLGIDFGQGLSEREVSYLMEKEWARSAEDVLWRRTKLGIEADDALFDELNDWMSAQKSDQ